MAIPWSTIGAAASAIGSVGNLFGMGGGDTSRAKQYAAMAKQIELQREGNEANALEMPRHMVAGAKRAGIHPALLFGASGLTPPSWSIGGIDTSSPSRGQAFAQMGQDLSRAIHAHMSEKERRNELAVAMRRQDMLDNINLERHKADLQHMNLQNQYLMSQIKRLEVQSIPPRPSDSDVVITPYDPHRQTGTQVGRWELEPARVVSADPDVRSLTAGPPEPGFKRYRFGGENIGWTAELPAGSSLSEALESMGGAVAPLYVWGHNAARWLDKKLYPNGKLVNPIRESMSRNRRKYEERR